MIKIILFCIILLLFIILNNNNKEHLKIVTYKTIAKKGSVSGNVSNLGKQIYFTAGGLVQLIFDTGDFAKYLIVDMPKKILKVANEDKTKNDPIVNIFGSLPITMDEEEFEESEVNENQKELSNNEIRQQLIRITKKASPFTKPKIIKELNDKALNITNEYNNDKIDYDDYKIEMEKLGFIIS